MHMHSSAYYAPSVAMAQLMHIHVHIPQNILYQARHIHALRNFAAKLKI